MTGALTNLQVRMLDVLDRNSGPMSVGLAELSSIPFSALITAEYVGLYRGANGIVYTHITDAGREALSQSRRKGE